jgi:hypothetical protein
MFGSFFNTEHFKGSNLWSGDCDDDDGGDDDDDDDVL